MKSFIFITKVESLHTLAGMKIWGAREGFACISAFGRNRGSPLGGQRRQRSFALHLEYSNPREELISFVNVCLASICFNCFLCFALRAAETKRTNGKAIKKKRDIEPHNEDAELSLSEKWKELK